MSQESADKLLNALNSDAALRKKFTAAGPDGFAKTAAAAGFSCSKEAFARSVKAAIVKSDPKKDVFAVADGIVSGISGGISSHVSGVGTGIA
ncbi:MAG: Nif11-like leader peptide family natural product precursor [Sideroxydans sp.]|nr:Nif11-like leader peptide family natural product precursor [Sideroxydans sp.]